MAKAAEAPPTPAVSPELMAFVNEASMLVRAGFNLINIPTSEFTGVVRTLRRVCEEFQTRWNEPAGLITWDIDQGFVSDELCPAILAKDTLGDTKYKSPVEALKAIPQLALRQRRVLFVFDGLNPLLEQTQQVRQTLLNLVRARAMSNPERVRPLFMITPSRVLHPDVAVITRPLEFPPPTDTEISELISFLEAGLERQPKARAAGKHVCNDELRGRVIFSVQGLWRQQCEDVLSQAIIEHEGFDPEMVVTIKDTKALLLGQTGTLSYIPDHAIPQREDLRGFDNAIPDVELSALAFTEAGLEAKLDKPRGLALLGVPGSGKSQFAKVVARIFHDTCGIAFPIYWVNVGAIFGKFIGQSEENLERLLTTLDAHKGCIAIFDEFEKTMGSTGESADSGVSNRIRGRLLNWMSEQKGATYVVVTMNSVEGVAPEFFRRFDATYYTDLPDESLRKEILQVHYRKRLGQAHYEAFAAEIDWDHLVTMTDQFVGSELEDVVIRSRALAVREKIAHGIPDQGLIVQAISDREQSIIAKVRADVVTKTREECKKMAKPVALPPRTKARRENRRGLHTG